jgi:hypothetical protein
MGENDADAVYCEQCGNPLGSDIGRKTVKRHRSFWYVVLIIAAAAAVTGLGYYKFFLPRGVAAVVNGEEITLAEVDGVVRSAMNSGDFPAEFGTKIRYEVLSRLITERIAEQEAIKAGIRASSDDVAEALNRSRAASGMDRDAFASKVAELHGSMRAFRKALERQITIRKFITERVAPGISDPTIANALVERWFQDISGRAVVRIALDEQLPSSGCGCCAKGGPASGTKGCDPAQGRPGSVRSGPQAEEARTAAIAYWQEHHGSGSVETRMTDYGCHIQIDIIQENRTAASLRYQNGTITEL